MLEKEKVTHGTLGMDEWMDGWMDGLTDRWLDG